MPHDSDTVIPVVSHPTTQLDLGLASEAPASTAKPAVVYDLSGSLIPSERTALLARDIPPVSIVALELPIDKFVAVGIDKEGNVAFDARIVVPKNVFEGFRPHLIARPNGKVEVPDLNPLFVFTPSARVLLPTTTLTEAAKREMHNSLEVQKLAHERMRAGRVPHFEVPTPPAAVDGSTP